MKAFVTGASGYLGRHLVAALRNAGREVTGVGSSDADLTRPDSLERFSAPFDEIWHLAAWTQAGDFCLRHPGEQWIINQQINTHVLDWWRRRQPRAKLTAIGTSCSYAPGMDLVEENYLAGEPVPELYSYGMTKRMLLVGLRAFQSQFGLRYLYLVPSTLFGPGYHTTGKQLHFIFDLIRKIVRGRHLGEPVRLWGDGHQKREIIYAPDFVAAALQLVEAVDNEVVNIGSGEEFSIRWYAERICGIAGYDPGKIEYDTSRYVGVRSKQLVIGKLRKLLPDFRLTPIEEALDGTVDWYTRALHESMESA